VSRTQDRRGSGSDCSRVTWPSKTVTRGPFRWPSAATEPDHRTPCAAGSRSRSGQYGRHREDSARHGRRGPSPAGAWPAAEAPDSSRDGRPPGRDAGRRGSADSRAPAGYRWSRCDLYPDPSIGSRPVSTPRSTFRARSSSPAGCSRRIWRSPWRSAMRSGCAGSFRIESFRSRSRWSSRLSTCAARTTISSDTSASPRSRTATR